jgi:hypothetical protein
MGRRTREARPLVSRREAVFEELKTYAAQIGLKNPAEAGPGTLRECAYCQRAGPGEGSVAAFSTARSISSTVMSGVMLTRTTPVELRTSDTAVADAASG